MARIGIAISGGGHRATLFGLGVLLYLSDVGKNREVASISSVSGGSLTNAYVGLRGTYSQQNAQDFWNTARQLASQIAQHGTLFAWIGTKVYLFVLILTGLAIIAVLFIPWPVPVRFLVFVVALILWEVTILRRRGEICGRAFAATLFSGSGPPPLSAIARDGIDHVLCATHLHAGEHLYFSGRFVYAYRFGWGSPGNLPLHVAVQASAALPGAFPPRWLRAKRFGFSGGAAPTPPSIALADGGVYDNVADQWLSGLGKRRQVPDHVQQPELFIIVNGSASMQMQPVNRLRLPIVGEIAALMRNITIMYDNSASVRKSDLVDRFDAFAAAPSANQFGVQGTLIDIASDPFRAASFFADQDDEWPDRAARARAVLGKRPDDWQSDSDWAAGVSTNLSKLGEDTSARLLRHAYAIAAMNLHVFQDFPLIDVPSIDHFRALCRDPAS